MVRSPSLAATALGQRYPGVAMSGARSLNLHREFPDKPLCLSSQALSLFTKTLQLSKACIVRNRHRDSV
jgi:hypothetical protein